jgi:hypothetical protein
MQSNPNRIIDIFLREYDFEKAAADEALMREFAEDSENEVKASKVRCNACYPAVRTALTNPTPFGDRK